MKTSALASPRPLTAFFTIASFGLFAVYVFLVCPPIVSLTVDVVYENSLLLVLLTFAGSLFQCAVYALLYAILVRELAIAPSRLLPLGAIFAAAVLFENFASDFVKMFADPEFVYENYLRDLFSFLSEICLHALILGIFFLLFRNKKDVLLPREKWWDLHDPFLGSAFAAALVLTIMKLLSRLAGDLQTVVSPFSDSELWKFFLDLTIAPAVYFLMLGVFRILYRPNRKSDHRA